MKMVDVVVVGSGVAGMTTALMASVAGLSVVILENTDLVGGATCYSSGAAFLPGCHHLPSEPDPASALVYLEFCMAGRMDRSMVETYLANGPVALAALEKHTEVRFKPYGGVDYRMNVPAQARRRVPLFPLHLVAAGLARR